MRVSFQVEGPPVRGSGGGEGDVATTPAGKSPRVCVRTQHPFMRCVHGPLFVPFAHPRGRLGVNWLCAVGQEQAGEKASSATDVTQTAGERTLRRIPSLRFLARSFSLSTWNASPCKGV